MELTGTSNEWWQGISIWTWEIKTFPLDFHLGPYRKFVFHGGRRLWSWENVLSTILIKFHGLKDISLDSSWWVESNGTHFWPMRGLWTCKTSTCPTKCTPKIRFILKIGCFLGPYGNRGSENWIENDMWKAITYEGFFGAGTLNSFFVMLYFY